MEVAAGRAWLAPVVAFALALVARLDLIALVPTNYSMDAYQRWAGRDALLVQDWLPATQLLVWVFAPLGITAVRVALAVVASTAVAAGALLARRLGTPLAAWLFVPVGVFGPFLAWSAVPYQEGTWLCLLFGGLALALGDRLRLADLVIGALALVRYEGWPVVLLYVAWRRDPRAALALWGMALWGGVKALGLQAARPSPVDYADWSGLSERFSWDVYSASAVKLVGQVLASGGWALGAAGLVGLGLCLRERRRGAGLLALVLLGQVLATAGWMAGLETATVRMQVVPGVLLGLFAAAGLSSKRASLVGLVAVLWFVPDGLRTAERSVEGVSPEVRLAERMADCEACAWWVVPRTGIGTRDRHDGCEIIQGVSELRRGVDFWCEGWDERPKGITHVARFRKGQGYIVTSRSR